MRQIDVLGVTIKDYSLREAMKMVDVFLRDGKLSTVTYITTRGLIAAETSESIKDFLTNVDLTITADSDILRAAGIVNRNRVREVDNDEFMREFLKKIVKARKTVYLLTSTKQQMETLQLGLASYQENLKIIGAYSLDELDEQGHDEDYLINEMNVNTPNVIISNISSPQRESFFDANHMKLNADIWLMLKDEVVHQKLTKNVWMTAREWFIKKMFARLVSKYRSDTKKKNENADESSNSSEG